MTSTPPSQDFTSAVEAVNGLARDPGNDVKLRLYAFYKQATSGDVSGSRPGFTNLVGRAKYDAWSAIKGMSPAEAEAAYIAEVDALTR